MPVREITIEDLSIHDSALSDCCKADYDYYRDSRPYTIHVGPGRYDECVNLSSWTADTPIQFIEPTPWYGGLEAIVLPVLLAVILVWAWARQNLRNDAV